MVILATCSGSAPAAARARPMLANTWRAWTARSPEPTRLPCSSSGSWPAMNTNLLPVATTTWVYVTGVGRSSGLMPSSVIALGAGAEQPREVDDQAPPAGLSATAHLFGVGAVGDRHA